MTTQQRKLARPSSGLLLAAPLCLAAAGALAASPYHVQTGDPSGSYQIDPVHSVVQFWIGHLGVSEFPGRFDKIEGSFTVDAAHPDNTKVSVTVPVDSLDTNFAQRNRDLLGPDFFNAKVYPTMSFHSTSAHWSDNHHGTLAGKLTLHGVTRPVTFQLRHVGAGPDPWHGYRSGYVANATIERSEFGMTYLLKGISDKVKIQINIEGKRQ